MSNGEHKAEVVHERSQAGVSAGVSAQEGFGTSSLARAAETTSTALAAQAKAAVEARYIIAMKKPRSWTRVRQDILDECKRPRFAQVARYRKPIGRGVEGPSIRFAEAALRYMTNVMPETATIFDDSEKRIVRVTVTDLESNLTYSQDVTIDKTVERSVLKDGQDALSVRTNSQGKRTYLVAATDDDLLNKQNALISKALRTLALRLLPGDILDEAMDQVIATQRNEDAKDPNAARKALVDAYATIGVKVDGIAEYLGHPVEQTTPDELPELRALFAAIRDGEATWREALDSKKKDREGGEGGVVASLKDRMKKAAEQKKTKAEEPKAEPPRPEVPKPETVKPEPKPAREPGDD